MKKDEIVKQYRLIRVFRPILRFLEIGIKWFVLPFLGCVILYVTIFNHALPFVMYGIYAFSLSGFVEDINAPQTNRFLRYYEEKWGMSYDQIEDYVSCREKLGGDDSISYLLPHISKLCQLNEGAKEEQKTFLSAFLSEDEIEDVFDKEYSDAQMEKSYQYWREKDIGERKDLVNFLFKLTILEDGIHNDEWNLLIQIMAQLKFNSRYIEYFKDRYYSLRTEFDDYERKSTSSQGEYSTASLESYYAVLGVEKEASIEEIKRAYHELAMQHHPDLPKNADRKEECEAKMMEINEAYEKVRG